MATVGILHRRTLQANSMPAKPNILPINALITGSGRNTGRSIALVPRYRHWRHAYRLHHSLQKHMNDYDGQTRHQNSIYSGLLKIIVTPTTSKFGHSHHIR